MSEIQVGQINSTDGSTAITTGADGYVSFAKTQIGGRRNLIINGAMQVAQRGTSSTSNGYATVDRFQFSVTNTDEFASTKTQEADGPDGFPNSFKVVATTPESSVASNERLRVIHFVEAQDLQHLGFGTSSAKSTTLSFYVKSNVTGTYGFSMYQGDSGRLIGGTYTINSADTWEQKTLTFAGDTSGTINNDNGLGFGMEWYLLAGSNYTGTDNTSWVAGSADKRAYGHTANWGETTSDYFQITGVQLEVGTVATPYEHISYGEQLALCQRYYQQLGRTSSDAGAIVGMVRNTHFTSGFFFTTSMRAAPTGVAYGSGSTSGVLQVVFGSTTDATHTANSSDVKVELLSTETGRFRVLSTSGSNGEGAYVDLGTGSQQVGITLDAEL